MSNEKQTIYEFDLDIIHDYFSNTERQGPGSPEITLKALSFIDGLTEKSKIADIGCGTGGQTMVLAQNTASEIIGVELCSDYVKQFNQNTQNQNLQDRVKGVVGNMKNLPFQEEELDLIWSEGAIYNIGFENGLIKWKNYLKVGGYLAVSEITWITQSRPKEIEDIWKKEYSEVDIASNKIKQLEKNGYTLIGYFYLSQDSWIENYYKPMEARFETFLKRNNNSELARKVVEDNKAEIDLYQKYKDYYSYGFYIARKN